MSTSTENIKLTFNDKSSTGQVIVLTKTFAESLARTIFISLIILVATFFSIFIPIVHFIFVPLGLFLTVYFFIKNLRPRKIIISGPSSCPVCAAEFRIMKREYSSSFTDPCENCGRSLNIKTSDETNH